MPGTLPRVLFLCVENSCRSQMAEAFARALGQGRIRPYSAGSSPSGVVNPEAIASMATRGLDLTAATSKSVDDLGVIEFDVVVSMGCGDRCPTVMAGRRIEWEIPDPKALAPAAFAQIRDRIEASVVALIEELAPRQ